VAVALLESLSHRRTTWSYVFSSRFDFFFFQRLRRITDQLSDALPPSSTPSYRVPTPPTILPPLPPSSLY
jgi:hypothetical protein